MQKFYFFWLVGVLILVYLSDILCVLDSRALFFAFTFGHDDLFRSDQSLLKLCGLIDVCESQKDLHISYQNVTPYINFFSLCKRFNPTVVCWFFTTLSLFYYRLSALLSLQRCYISVCFSRRWFDISSLIYGSVAYICNFLMLFIA